MLLLLAVPFGTEAEEEADEGRAADEAAPRNKWKWRERASSAEYFASKSAPALRRSEVAQTSHQRE